MVIKPQAIMDRITTFLGLPRYLFGDILYERFNDFESLSSLSDRISVFISFRIPPACLSILLFVVVVNGILE